MDAENKGRFDTALSTDNAEETLITLVDELKAEGFSQIQIYILFEERMILANDEEGDENYNVLGIVLDYIAGWCKSDKCLFPLYLSDSEISEHKLQQSS